MTRQDYIMLVKWYLASDELTEHELRMAQHHQTCGVPAMMCAVQIARNRREGQHESSAEV